MADPEIPPALTPDEWAFALTNGYIDRTVGLHGSIALALHGQPFGFTRRDVDELLALAEEDDRRSHGRGLSAGTQRLYSLAARISALLPPESMP